MTSICLVEETSFGKQWPIVRSDYFRINLGNGRKLQQQFDVLYESDSKGVSCKRFNTNNSFNLVGRPVTSYTCGPQFESSHRQSFKELLAALKRQNQRKKKPGMAHLKV